MKTKKFLEENLGRIYEYNGSFVELVGHLDGCPGVINIVRYLDPDRVRARGEGWTLLCGRDMIAQGYYKLGSVYSYVLQSDLKQVTNTDAARAFAEAYNGEKFSINYFDYRELKPL